MSAPTASEGESKLAWQATESKYLPKWALGFAVAMETLPNYSEYYNGPVNPFTQDAPLLKSVHEWIRTIFWMGKDLSEFCCDSKEVIEVQLCYPRASYPPVKTPDDSQIPTPQPATASAPVTSESSESSDISTSSTIAVVTVALMTADSLQEAQQLLLDRYNVCGSFPMEEYWEKIVNRLELPEDAKIPRVYQVWDSDVGPLLPDKAPVS